MLSSRVPLPCPHERDKTFLGFIANCAVVKLLYILILLFPSKYFYVFSFACSFFLQHRMKTVQFNNFPK